MLTIEKKYINIFLGDRMGMSFYNPISSVVIPLMFAIALTIIIDDYFEERQTKKNKKNKNK